MEQNKTEFTSSAAMPMSLSEIANLHSAFFCSAENLITGDSLARNLTALPISEWLAKLVGRMRDLCRNRNDESVASQLADDKVGVGGTVFEEQNLELAAVFEVGKLIGDSTHTDSFDGIKAGVSLRA
jgi:hypothetical protein